MWIRQQLQQKYQNCFQHEKHHASNFAELRWKSIFIRTVSCTANEQRLNLCFKQFFSEWEYLPFHPMQNGVNEQQKIVTQSCFYHLSVSSRVGESQLHNLWRFHRYVSMFFFSAIIFSRFAEEPQNSRLQTQPLTTMLQHLTGGGSGPGIRCTESNRAGFRTWHSSNYVGHCDHIRGVRWQTVDNVSVANILNYSSNSWGYVRDLYADEK